MVATYRPRHRSNRCRNLCTGRGDGPGGGGAVGVYQSVYQKQEELGNMARIERLALELNV